MTPKATRLGLLAIVAVLLVGGLVVYLRPFGELSSSGARLASIEDCTYTITSNISYNPYGSPGIVVTGTTTITSSYSTNATVKMTVGAVTTSTTSLSYRQSVSTIAADGGGPPEIEIIQSPDYIGQPYTVSCTYVK